MQKGSAQVAESELNEPQRRAVVHAAGPLLVFAGAGSGKTRVITYRVANLLAVHRVPPYRILAVTFTNKAAAEMRKRLAQLAGPEATDDLWVGTFHSVCARLLRRHSEAVGLTPRFSIYDESDQKAVVARLLKKLQLDERRFPPKFILNRISAHKREGRGPEDEVVEAELGGQLAGLFAQYQSTLIAANAVDFDDLILHIMRLAEAPDSPIGQTLRRRYDHVLVDEFQDTNLVQYRLVRALSCQTHNLCVVGDDDQSIYRWRGADVRLIRNFRKDFPTCTVIKLEQNYRSTGNIVDSALGVISAATERAPKRLWTEVEAGDPVRLRAVRDERDEAQFVVGVIQQQRERGLCLSDVAVFYRVHAQSRVLEEALRNANLPYQVVGGMKFFERAEVKDLLAYLRLVDNPQSNADLARIINVPARGIGAKTIDRVFTHAAEQQLGGMAAVASVLDSGSLGAAAHRRVTAFRALIEQLREESEALGPRELAAHTLERTGYEEALEKQDSAEADARLGNLQELLSSIAEYEQACLENGEEVTLSGYLERVSLITAVDTMQDVPSVSLMTVHAAKGLEYEAVILTGMEEEIFPYRGLNEREIDDLEEERRLAYVAITRARKLLWITHAGQRSLFGRTRYLESSRFLRDLPPAAIRHEGSAPVSHPARASAWPASGDARGSWPAHEPVLDADGVDDIPPDEPGWTPHPGDRVRHVRFGRGVVESVEFGARPNVIAEFPDVGTKRIRADYLIPD